MVASSHAEPPAEQQARKQRPVEAPAAPAAVDAPLPGGVRGQLLALQRTVGNAAVAQMLASRKRAMPQRAAHQHGKTAGAAGYSAGSAATASAAREEPPPVQRLVDEGQASAIRAKASETERQAAKAGERRPDGPQPAKAEIDPEKKAALKGQQQAAFRQPDKVSAEKGRTQQAAAETKLAAAAPTEPHAAAAPTAGATDAALADGGGHASAAQEATAVASEATGQAERAVAEAHSVEVPALPEAVAVPQFSPPAEEGAGPIEADARGDGTVAAAAVRIQQLRHAGHALMSEAAATRARGHALDAGISTARAKVANAEGAVATLHGYVEQRRQAVGQAKAAHAVSEQKAAMVAAQAPEFVAKAEEGKAKSSPMAAEASGLAGQAASAQPDDEEAAGKSREQAGQISKAGTDLGQIDAAIGQTGQRASGLVSEAAAAQAKNADATARIAASESVLGATSSKLQGMTAQSSQAKSTLAGLQDGPADLQAGAAALSGHANDAMDASRGLEQQLHAAQTAYLAARAAAVPTPATSRPATAVQRQAFADRERAQLVSGVPEWLSGEEPASAQERANQLTEANQRREAELAAINAAADGNFSKLDAGTKMGLALRLTFSRLTGELGETNWPKFGATLLRGFVDPRVSLAGVLSGLNMILSGGANLLSLSQWKRDPLGNLLKSAADIATGITIVLGSIAGLAIAIIAICAAAILLTFGLASPVCLPVISICTTVAATVGPWAVEAAAIALELNAYVLIKNLVDAATADNANKLQGSVENMAEDTKTMGAMAMVIAGEKAGNVVGPKIAGVMDGVEASLNASSSAAANRLGAAVGDIGAAMAEGQARAVGRVEPPVLNAEDIAPAAPAGDTAPPAPEAPAAGPGPAEGAPQGPAAEATEPPVGPTETIDGERVVAEQPGTDGHQVKVTEDGRCLVCSTCEEMRLKYREEIAANENLDDELSRAEAIEDPDAKAKAEAEVQAKLEAQRKAARATETPEVKSARLTDDQQAAQQALAKLRERLRTRAVLDAFKEDGALKGRIEGDVRTLQSEMDAATSNAQAAAELGDPALTDEAAEKLEDVRVKADLLESEVKQATEPPVTGEVPRPALGYPKNMLPAGGDYPYVSGAAEEVAPAPGGGGGYLDQHGNVWQVDPTKARTQKFFEWDVQHPDGSHTNVGSDGSITHGDNNFPEAQRPPKDRTR